MSPGMPPAGVKDPAVDFVQMLHELWEGEEGVMGYQSSKIVQALCTMAPSYTDPTEQWVLNHLKRGYIPAKDCDPEELEIIKDGLERWRKAGRPRATFVPAHVKKEISGGE